MRLVLVFQLTVACGIPLLLYLYSVRYAQKECLLSAHRGNFHVQDTSLKWSESELIPSTSMQTVFYPRESVHYP
jgi:hypothetical protein